MYISYRFLLLFIVVIISLILVQEIYIMDSIIKMNISSIYILKYALVFIL